MTLPELIAALERTERPSRELDAEIARHCGIEWSSDEDGQWGGYSIMPQRVRFTSSLDAALSLLPQEEWMSWKIEGGTDPEVQGAIACVAIWSERDHADLLNNGIRYGTKWRTGATPAIALCIAALKARA